jgi:uncharacterized protein YbjT (DUF2867 family)
VRILVTGGTGFLASHLIPALQRRGHAVRALAPPSADPGRLSKSAGEFHSGDVRQPETLGTRDE